MISGSYPPRNAETLNSLGHKRDKSADGNVFLVGRWKGISDDRYKDVNGSYIIGTRDIVMDDLSSYDEFMTSLGHEVGHFLGHRQASSSGIPTRTRSTG